MFGNEHQIRDNEIDHVCTETADDGAIYIGYDPTYRGNLIQGNFIHDLGGFSQTDIVGIYLDDFASGTLVENNRLVRTVRGIAVGEGRDNVILNNVILESLAAIQVDARGLTWAKSHIQGPKSRISQLVKQALAAEPVFNVRYPELQRLLQPEAGLPLGNIIRGNRYDCPIGIDIDGFSEQLILIEDKHRIDLSDRLSRKH